MIKYASFMISLQNGNHGSTDLTDFFYWFREFLPENLEPQLRTRILQHQTWLAGKSPSWRILMVKSSWNQRFPCHLWFPVVSMNPISLYTILYWLYIAHMSTYVFIYIYICTILHPQYDISSSACWGSRPSTSISLSKAGSAGRNSASLKLSVPRLCRIQW